MKRVLIFISLLAMIPLSASGYWKLVDSRIVPTSDYKSDKSLTVSVSLTSASIVHRFKDGDETITHSSSSSWLKPPSIIKPEDEFGMTGSFTVNEAANNFAVTVYTLSVSAVENDGGIRGSVVTVSEGTWVSKKWEIRSPVSFGEGSQGQFKRIHVDAYKNIILFTYEWKEGPPPGSFLGIKKKVRSAFDEGPSGKAAAQGETSQSDSSSEKKEKLPLLPAAGAAAGLAIFGALPEFINLLIKKKGPNAASKVKTKKKKPVKQKSPPGGKPFMIDGLSNFTAGTLTDAAYPDNPSVSEGKIKKAVAKDVMTAVNILSDAQKRMKEGYSFNEAHGLSTIQNVAANAVMNFLGPVVGLADAALGAVLPDGYDAVLPSNLTKDTVQCGFDLYFGGAMKGINTLRNGGSLADAAENIIDTMSEDVDLLAEKALQGKRGIIVKGFANAAHAAGEMYGKIEKDGLFKCVKEWGTDIARIYKYRNQVGADIAGENIKAFADAASKGSGPIRAVADMAKLSGELYESAKSKGLVKTTSEYLQGFVKNISSEKGQQAIADKATQYGGKMVSGFTDEAASLMGEYVGKGGSLAGGAKMFMQDCGSILKNLWTNGFG